MDSRRSIGQADTLLGVRQNLSPYPKKISSHFLACAGHKSCILAGPAQVRIGLPTIHTAFHSAFPGANPMSGMKTHPKLASAPAQEAGHFPMSHHQSPPKNQYASYSPGRKQPVHQDNCLQAEETSMHTVRCGAAQAAESLPQGLYCVNVTKDKEKTTERRGEEISRRTKEK